MKVALHTYNESVNCENNYIRTFADYEDLLLTWWQSVMMDTKPKK